ncbi:MAG TPA: LysR substrate-binding domain-containing protein, partial [Polyangiaceae bacterium]
ADLEESSAALAGAQTALAGNLVVTASVTFGNLHVVPLLLSFLRAHPEMTGRALLFDRVVDLREEGVDVAVRIAHLRDSSLRAIRVGSVRAVCCASPGYLEKHGRPRTPDDLRDHAIVAFAGSRGSGDWLFPGARRAKRVALAPRFVTNDTQASLVAARAGHGIVRALSYQIADDVRTGRLVVVLDRFEPAPIPVHVVHAAGSGAPARIRAFVDYAVDRLRSDPRVEGALRRGPKSQPDSRK